MRMLTVKSTPRTQPDASPLLANGSGDRLNDLQSKSTSILDAPAVTIRSLVGHILQELLDQESIRSVHLYTVKSSFDSISCSLSVELDVFLDLSLRHLSRCTMFGIVLDGRWGDVGVSIGRKNGRVCRSSERP